MSGGHKETADPRKNRRFVVEDRPPPLPFRPFPAFFAAMAMRDRNDASRKGAPSSAAFKVGAIALAFLIIGYQAALFVGRAARLRLEAHRDRPDTVFVYSSAPESLVTQSSSASAETIRRMQDLINSQEKEIARLRQANARRIKKPAADTGLENQITLDDVLGQ